jgi:glycerol-3-phosphate dehydrogenase (NAD(P)+)
MNNVKTKITVIGAGSWGTTLAVILARSGNEVDLWIRSSSTYDEILSKKVNSKYTGDLAIPDNVKPFTGKCSGFSKGTEIILLAIPSHALRDVIKDFYQPLEKSSSGIKCILNVAKAWKQGQI